MMNRFTKLNENELLLVKEAGYEVENNKEYSEEDYKKCKITIWDYIMSHSKNEIQKVESKFSKVLSKIS